jgi:CheY-like chemotaxis protein
VLDLNEVVANLSGMLPRLIGEDIVLVTTLDPAAGRVKADPGQLDQILINLVLNAGEAMPRGGRITLETAGLELDEEGARRHSLVRPGRYAMLAVSDTGLGMDEATKARIFEPFFTTKKPGEGPGLGLAAVYGMVQQNGGSIAADSVKGRGTVFRVYLPQTDELPQPAVMDSVGGSVRGSETVLLVEDDKSVRTLIQGVLARQGYQVLPAQDGQEALRVFGDHQGPIHLLLTDVGMPGLSGPQLADRLVPQRPHMKVLYISGYADEAMVRKGLPANTRSFLLKPFAPDILVRRVREILDAGR